MHLLSSELLLPEQRSPVEVWFVRLVRSALRCPRITLTGEFGFQSTALASLFSGPRRFWSFIPQITQPIFTAGRLRSQVELAEAQQRSALAQYENAIQSAFRDVSDALIQYQKVREIRAQCRYGSV